MDIHYVVAKQSAAIRLAELDEGSPRAPFCHHPFGARMDF
jgi:hypothetical protein